MDQTKFRALLLRTVVVPLVAALILAGGVLWAAYDLNDAMQWVDHTDQVIGQSRRLLKLLVDMETGLRGYLVTGNDVFLQPYQEASKAVDSEYEALYRLVADNPPQQTRMERLHDSFHHWQSYAEQMIALRRAGGAYADLKVNLAGKREMDDVRDQIAGFQDVEEHLREERTRTAHRNWRLVAASCILLGLGVGSGLAVFTLRRMQAIAASFEESLSTLAESERRWVTTLASIGDAVLATDASGRITFMNGLAESLSEWTQDQTLGQHVDEVFKLEDELTGAPLESPATRAIRLQRVIELANHAVLIGRKGTRVPIDDSAAPIRDATGKVAGVVLVFRDVTDRRTKERERAEALLREQVQRQIAEDTANRLRKIESVTEAAMTGLPLEKMLQQLLLRTTEALQTDTAVILLLDEQTQFLEVRAASSLAAVREGVRIPVGLGVAGTIAKTGQLRIIEDLAEAVVPCLRENPAALMGAPLVVDDRVIGVIHVDSKKPRKFTDAEASLLRVVADRVALTIDRKQAEEELRESREWLRVTLTSIGDAVMTADTHGRITFLNPVAAALTGWKAEEAQGRPIQSIFHIINEQTRVPAEDIVARVLEEGRVFELANHTALITKDGREMPIEDSAAPIRDSSGNVMGVVLVFHDVTEKRRAREALRHLSAIVESSDDAIIGKTLEGVITSWNRGASRLYGYSAAEMIGQPISLLIPADHPGEEPEILRTLAMAERVEQYETVRQRKDGSLVDVSLKISPILDESGNVGGASTIARDITERRKIEAELERHRHHLEELVQERTAELESANAQLQATITERERAQEAFRESESAFATLANHVPQLVWMCTPDGLNIYFNQRWVEYTGLTLEESYGRGWNTPFHPDDKQAAWDAWNHATRTGGKYYVESRLRAADGSYRWFLMLGEPLGNAHGSVVRWFGTCTDIEDLKRAEEELRRSEEARKVAEAVHAERMRAEERLRNSERVYRAIGESNDYGVWICAPDGRNTYTSESFLRLVGITQQQCSDFGWGDVLHPDDAERTIAAWKECVRTGGNWDIEHRCRGVDGKWHPILARGVPVRDDRGQIMCWAGINLDISGLKQAEQALIRSEKLASVGRMAASIAHEINNPLAAVMNTIFLAKMNADEPEPVRQYLDMADDELKRIAHITRQTLGFYRESSAPATVSVKSILDSAVDLLGGKIRVKGATIERQYDGEFPVTAVPGELRQVFSNLLANSLDAMGEQGTIKLRVSKSTCVNSHQPRIRVTVADDGKGIDAATLPRIFEPLFTTKEATGSGLGLWVSKQLIEKHGGAIRVRSRTSEPRRGTVFSIFLAAEVVSGD